jgi:hypothetical protein
MDSIQVKLITQRIREPNVNTAVILMMRYEVFLFGSLSSAVDVKLGYTLFL